MEQTQQVDRRKLFIRLAAAAGALLLLLGLAVLLGLDLRACLKWGQATIKWGLDLISSAGPVVFFACMVVLPALGVPMLAFVLPAGALFRDQFGLGGVIALCLAAVTANMLLSYSLARWILRPWLSRLIVRLGYKLPELEGSDATDLLVILRVTPGVPFFVQNYMSGLADIPLGRYLLISCLIAWSFNTAFVFFGDALLHGQGRLVMIGFGAIVALVAILHMVRHHYAAKKKSQ
jgi:uncharacterized membrane protein YdjX (TVP38/TMEM64 family)